MDRRARRRAVHHERPRSFFTIDEHSGICWWFIMFVKGVGVLWMICQLIYFWQAFHHVWPEDEFAILPHAPDFWKNLTVTPPFPQNLTVALDGTGKFSTVWEAVAAAPSFSRERLWIYVKAGVYHESIRVPKEKTNISFIGDGIEETFVIYDGASTDLWEAGDQATLVVEGEGFVAMFITFVNTANASNVFGVAMKTTSVSSGYYGCSFSGYRGTIQALHGRQFYKGSTIIGSSHLVHGNAIAAFDACYLYARTPFPGQPNALTAQSRYHPYQNSGFSFLGCNVRKMLDYQPLAPTFLGLPLGPSARIVFQRSFIEDFISPQGWIGSSDSSSTLYYGEYMNEGPGAATDGRDKRSGFQAIDAAEAAKFAVVPFIEGDKWLPQTGIPFDGYNPKQVCPACRT